MHALPHFWACGLPYLHTPCVRRCRCSSYMHTCAAPYAHAGEKVPHRFMRRQTRAVGPCLLQSALSPHQLQSRQYLMGGLLLLAEAEVWWWWGNFWQCQTRFWQSAVSTHRSLPPVMNFHLLYIFLPTLFPSLLQIPFEVPWFLFNPADAGLPL